MIIIQPATAPGSTWAWDLTRVFGTRQAAGQWLKKHGGRKPIRTALAAGRSLYELANDGEIQIIVTQCKMKRCTSEPHATNGVRDSYKAESK